MKELREYQQSEAYKMCAEKIQEKKIKKGELWEQRPPGPGRALPGPPEGGWAGSWGTSFSSPEDAGSAAANTLLNGHPHKVRPRRLCPRRGGRLRHAAAPGSGAGLVAGLGRGALGVQGAGSLPRQSPPSPHPCGRLPSPRESGSPPCTLPDRPVPRPASAVTPSPPSTCPSSPRSSWTKTRVRGWAGGWGSGGCRCRSGLHPAGQDHGWRRARDPGCGRSLGGSGSRTGSRLQPGVAQESRGWGKDWVWGEGGGRRDPPRCCVVPAAREAELRRLRKMNTEFEEQNAILQKHTESMNCAKEKLEQELAQEERQTLALQQQLQAVRQALTASFASLPIPGESGAAVGTGLQREGGDGSWERFGGLWGAQGRDRRPLPWNGVGQAGSHPRAAAARAGQRGSDAAVPGLVLAQERAPRVRRPFLGWVGAAGAADRAAPAQAPGRPPR